RAHLLQAGNLSELTLHRRGDRRGHDVRAGAGVKSQHLDRRIVDLRQGGNGKLAIGDDAREQNRNHQQRGGDRPQDEEAGGVHCVFRAPPPPPPARRPPPAPPPPPPSTSPCGWSPSAPPVTTSSPGSTPVTTAVAPSLSPTS